MTIQMEKFFILNRNWTDGAESEMFHVGRLLTKKNAFIRISNVTSVMEVEFPIKEGPKNSLDEQIFENLIQRMVQKTVRKIVEKFV